jgi:hypothetical protein
MASTPSEGYGDVPFLTDEDFEKFNGLDDSRQALAAFRQSYAKSTDFLNDTKAELEAMGVDTATMMRSEAMITRLKARYAEIIKGFGYELDWVNYSVNELSLIVGELQGRIPASRGIAPKLGGVKAYLAMKTSGARPLALAE